MNQENTITAEELERARNYIPPMQFACIRELLKGEDAPFFVETIQKINETVKNITGKNSYNSETKTHAMGLHYFIGESDFYVTEILDEGLVFGYGILNGDVEMSEFGYMTLAEMLSIRGMELDFNQDTTITVEKALYRKYPDFFEDYKNL